MVAYDELGTLVPIKRTLQVIDLQNQANKELEVREERRAGIDLSRCSLLVSVVAPSPKSKVLLELLSDLSESLPIPVLISCVDTRTAVCLCVHTGVFTSVCG